MASGRLPLQTETQKLRRFALQFGGMALRELPSDLFRLSNVAQLWLNNNEIRSLPSNIAQLRKLKKLTVRVRVMGGF